MGGLQIIAVAIEGEPKLEHITHIFTSAGSTPKQEAVENLWFGKAKYYTYGPVGRTEVHAVPASPISGLLSGVIVSSRPYLRSAPNSFMKDNLLHLPRWAAPDSKAGLLANALMR